MPGSLKFGPYALNPTLISPRNYEDLQSSVDEAGQYHIVTEDVKKAEGGDLINQPVAAERCAPKAETRNPKPETLSPTPETLNR